MDFNDQPDGPEMSERLAATEQMRRSVHAEFGLLTAQELSVMFHIDPDVVRGPLTLQGRWVRCAAADASSARVAPGEWPTPDRPSYARAVP